MWGWIGLLGVFKRVDSLGRRLVIVLQGLPCSWGRCSFCPFVLEQSARVGEVIETNRRILEEAYRVAREFNPDRVSVFNGSSFFELPVDTVLRLPPLTRGRVVDVEARSEQVWLEALSSLLKLLEARKLVVRVGFEVWDEKIRNEYLRKGMPQSEVYRLARLREEVRERGLPIEFLVYVLFGIEGVGEEEVRRSVQEFSKLFDGVVCVRYHRYLPGHPREVPISSELRRFLEENCLLVDWGEEEEWTIAGKKAT